MGRRLFAVIAATAATALMLNPRAAAAQAWVPAAGEGSVSILYQDLFVADHFFDRGQRRDRGEIHSSNLLVDFTYGITDRLAVTVGVPFIRARYAGRAPHPTVQDNGETHAGVQDLRFAARYNVVDGPLTITPFVSVNVPSHAYEYFAHASLGTRMREVEIGAYVGRVLTPKLPNAFVQASYSYSFPEEIVGIQVHRSNLSVEFGYFLTRSIRVFTMGNGLTTHGGVAVPEAGYRVLPVIQQSHHDRIGGIDLLDVGGGIQMSLTDRIEVFGSYMKSLAGRNTHAIDRGVTIGMSWSFGGGGLPSLGPADSGGDEADRQLGKCLCTK